MRIPTWRLLLTGGAITILAIGGIGFAAAAGTPATSTDELVAPAATTGPDASNGVTDRIRLRDRVAQATDLARPLRALRFGRHLVHAEITVTDRDGNLVYLQLDHGTIQSVSSTSLVIAEAGGGTEGVTLDDATIVWVGRDKGTTGDLEVGAEVVVQSRVDGSTVLAKRIVILPAATS